MNNKVILGLIVIGVGFGIGWYLLKGRYPNQTAKQEISTTISPTNPVNRTETPVPTEFGITAENEVAVGEKGGVISKTTVNYTDNGFTPNKITMKKGMTVIFINASSSDMWVASAVHPTHQVLPGFDQLKGVKKGGMYAYTFEKVGTWQYHNHIMPNKTGSVIVTE